MTYTITATQNPFSFQVLNGPSWLSVSTQSGLISGPPAAPGVFTMQLEASNSAGSSNPFSLTLNVAAAANTPIIYSASPPSGTVGSSYTYQITYSSVPPAPTSFVATGLPSAVFFNSTTGVISGNPTNSGLFPVSIAAFNANGEGEPVTITFTIQPNLQISF